MGREDAGGRSVGCNITLPLEQAPNRYLDGWVTCRHFFVRKVLLFKYLLRVRRAAGRRRHDRRALRSVHSHPDREDQSVPDDPDRDRLLEALDRSPGSHGHRRRDPASRSAVSLRADSVDEAMRHLERHAIDQFALRHPRPSRWLGERAPSTPRAAPLTPGARRTLIAPTRPASSPATDREPAGLRREPGLRAHPVEAVGHDAESRRREPDHGDADQNPVKDNHHGLCTIDKTDAIEILIPTTR